MSTLPIWLNFSDPFRKHLNIKYTVTSAFIYWFLLMLLQECLSMLVQLISYATPACLIDWLPFGDLYNKCSQILAWGEAVKCGRFELTPFVSEEDYLTELFIIQNKVYSRSIVNPHAKWSQLYKQIVNEVASIKLTQQDGRLREQPFGILVYGDPGCGKSMTTVKLVKELYDRLGLPLTAHDVVTLNETDEFQSEYKSSHKVVVFDDVGQSSLVHEPSDYTRKLIDFINNIPKVALNPHLQMKGKIRIRPDVVIATTNRHTVDTKGNDEFTEPVICPDAVMRRFKLIVRAEMDDKYDRFTIMQYTGFRSRNKGSSYFKDIKEVDFKGLLDHATSVCKAHRESQKNFTSMINDVFAKEDTSSPGISVKDMFKVMRQPRFHVEGNFISQTGKKTKSVLSDIGTLAAGAAGFLTTMFISFHVAEEEHKKKDLDRITQILGLEDSNEGLRRDVNHWKNSCSKLQVSNNEYSFKTASLEKKCISFSSQIEDLSIRIDQLVELNNTL
uniref:Structural polyprotein n=1 Tax=Marine RNA virus BC-8 TaxID=2320701 RepID=A0A386JC54_9VIRU|nr:structural polyprotein [Marine RNA virus BC-8]